MSNWRFWLPRVLLIAGLTLWIYWPALRGDWIWDDSWYIRANPLMQGWQGLWKFWFQPGSWVEYYPIEESVLWIEWHLWQNNTLGYHLVSVILHLINALLVWRLLGRFNLRLAWLGGLIFAVHPMQVESVAYISELKNTLSLPFFLLAMNAWIDYDESHRRRDYLMALGLFLIGMLCKITLAALPVVILLYAWWKRGRVGWKDLKVSIPFFIISVGMSFATVYVANVYYESLHASVPDVPLGGFLPRLVGAGLTFVFYVSMSLLPATPLLVHPKWVVDPSSPVQYLPLGMLAVVVWWCWQKRTGWGRHILLGLGFFGLTLLPFLGFNAISYMYDSWVEEHLLYLPIIGLIGLVVAGLGDLLGKLPRFSRPWIIGAMTAVIFMMTWESRAYAALWVNPETLWGYTLRHNPSAVAGHANIGSRFLEKGNIPQAIVQFEEAVRLNPDFAAGRVNLAALYNETGRVPEAEIQYRQLMVRNPKGPGAYLDLAAIFLKEGRGTEAIDLYEQAIKYNPDMVQLRYNLGNALLDAGKLPEAIEQLKVAVQLDPHLAAAHENLGVALAQSGHASDAIGEFKAALEIDPTASQTHKNLGFALAQTGQIPEAIEQFEILQRLSPEDPDVQKIMASLHAAQKKASGR